MNNFIYNLEPIFQWLFFLGVLADVILVVSRHFIKNESTEKKRSYLFYCALEATMVFLFVLGLYGVNMPDHAIWNLVIELSGGMTIIMGFFVAKTYADLWLQLPPKVTKTTKKKAKAK